MTTAFENPVRKSFSRGPADAAGMISPESNTRPSLILSSQYQLNQRCNSRNGKVPTPAELSEIIDNLERSASVMFTAHSKAKAYSARFGKYNNPVSNGGTFLDGARVRIIRDIC